MIKIAEKLVLKQLNKVFKEEMTKIISEKLAPQIMEDLKKSLNKTAPKSMTIVMERDSDGKTWTKDIELITSIKRKKNNAEYTFSTLSKIDSDLVKAAATGGTVTLRKDFAKEFTEEEISEEDGFIKGNFILRKFHSKIKSETKK